MTFCIHYKQVIVWQMKNREWEQVTMVYKTIVIDYAPKAKKMAAAIEETANEMACLGWEIITFSVTNSAKAILLFRAPEDDVTPEQTVEAVGEAE